MKHDRIAALILSVTLLGGCVSMLKEPLWSDHWEASPDAWVFQPGIHQLGREIVLEMRPDGLTYREPDQKMVIEAVDPEPAAAGQDTHHISGGKSYRIVRVDCGDAQARCTGLKTAQRIAVTPARVQRTPLDPAQLSVFVAARQFDAVWISVSGSSGGFRSALERQAPQDR